MAGKLPQNNRFAFKGVLLDQPATEKRRIINKIPGVNQTETLQKFFSAGADHLFQPGSSKPINGFIGQRPSYYDAKQDYYLEESTAIRRFYQLEPAMTSSLSDGTTVDSLLTYDDLINQLRFQGGIVNNHHRMFSQEYYTWCPPIDVDKFLNFREYYWLPEGPTPTPLYGHSRITLGDSKAVDFPLPLLSTVGLPSYDNLARQFVRVFVDNVEIKAFTYPGVSGKDFLTLAAAPAVGSEVAVYVRGNIREDLKHLARTSASYGVTLTSNLRVQVFNDLDTSLNGKIFILENIGEGKTPILIPDDLLTPVLAPKEMLINGDFLLGPSTPDGTFTTVLAPSEDIPGWRVVDGSVDYKNNYFQGAPGGGLRDLDLAGNEPGTIEQTFATDVGTVYRVSFSLAGNPDQNDIGNVLHQLQVTVADAKQTYTFDSTGKTRTNMGWVKQEFTFTANDTTATLRLAALSDGPCGPVVDLVSVTPLYAVDQEALSRNYDYLVMARGCVDGNAWSTGNRWFHRSVVGSLGSQARNVQAKRPIIEFQRDLELYNFGSKRRPSVHLVSDDIPDFVGSVVNKQGIARTVDGYSVTTDWITATFPDTRKVRILVTGDRNPAVNNKVYQVAVLGDKLQLSVITDGEDVAGLPVFGEVINVTMGRAYGGQDLYWDGISWKYTQTKKSENQAPLFQLYDYDGVRLQDVGRYPGSDFRGSKLFGYASASSAAPNDTVLNFPISNNNQGEIEFYNFLGNETYSYVNNGVVTPVLSYGFHRNTTAGEAAEFNNDWYLVDHHSRQMVVDQFVASKGARLFTMSQEPAPDEGALPNLEVRLNNTLLAEGIDYIRQGNQVLISAARDGDNVETRTFNPANKSERTPGLYEVPLNLSANPAWEDIGVISRGEVYDHFTEIMRKQTGFVGVEYADNNWRDTAQARNLGSGIVQHSAPLLRTMLLASRKDLDFTVAAQYAETEYARFRARFEQKIHDFEITGKFSTADNVSLWIDAALDDLTRGYTQQFPFYYSGMAATEARPLGNFIPATPSFLGIYPAHVPEFVVDADGEHIVGHDGSRTPAFGDFRDEAVLAMETRIYNSIADHLVQQERPFFDTVDLVASKYRSGAYSREEYQLLLRSSFERWCSTNGVDYQTNHSFDALNPFTWNWSGVRSRDNRVLPGHWRGIYKFYYDTDRPHTHPWEMLGFAAEPTWWALRYGTAPFTRDNTILWGDLELGYIHDGERQNASDPLWARPGLSAIIPVDDQGELLNPFDAGITSAVPTPIQARSNWTYGDGCPAETAWSRTYWYPFAVARANYFMKPASFLEFTWDSNNLLRVGEGSTASQLISKFSGRRQNFATEYVHGETNSNGDVVVRVGVQQWISDYLINQGKDVTENFGRYVRGLGAQLAYKVGGFTDSKSLYVVSESFDRIPQEDVHVELYKSPSVREEFYGGVIIQWNGSQWRVFGFDTVDPVFKVMPPDRNGASVSISAAGTKGTRVPNWAANTYYTVNATVRYLDRFYRCLRTHTSGSSFEVDFWKEVARPEVFGNNSVAYYLDPQTADYVERIPYGSFIRTQQEMSDFLSGYERYLESRGWVFDRIIPNESTTSDWKTACKDFLTWSHQDSLPAGSFLALSPLSNGVKFVAEHGTVQPVEQIINGVYSILDKNAQVIQPTNTNVIRDNSTISIVPLNRQEIFATRLFVSEVEHVIVLNNTTIFKDVIYSPLLNIRQPRLRLQGFKTRDWRGRVDAPGFLVTGNMLTPNFEKAADDFRGFFDIESVENSQLKERARANIGYYERDYLNNLLMTPTNQFEFYQGMIQQKGTAGAFKRLLRSNFIRHNDGLQFLEEWAFRLGDYGAGNARPSTDIQLRQRDITNNPQIISFNAKQIPGTGVSTNSILFAINGIAAVNVTQAGTQFRSTPTFEVTGGGGSGVKLEAVMDWSHSAVASVTVTSGGSGFALGDILKIEGAGEGAAAVASKVDFLHSAITRVWLDLPTGVSSAGRGYTVGQIVYFNGGNGRGIGKISSVDNKGGITGITLVNAGGGYDPSQLAVSFDGTNITARDFIKFEVAGGALKEAQVISGGAGYDENTVIRMPSNTRDAAATVVVSGGTLASVKVVEPGSGYSSVPAIRILGGSPKLPANVAAVLDHSPVPASIDLAEFTGANHVILSNVRVEILVPFNGTQPVISIGDSERNGRYADSITLGGKNAFRIALSDDRVTTLNAGEDMQVYLRNISTKGSLRVTVEYSFTEDYYRDSVLDNPFDSVVDVTDVFSEDTGEYLFRDNRWVVRHTTQQPEWPTSVRPLNTKGGLPNAGYVQAETDVKWTARNWQEFLSLYRDKQALSPNTYLYENVTINYQEGLSVPPAPQKITLVPNLNEGLFVVTKFTISVGQGFPIVDGVKPTFSVGDGEDPEKYIRLGQVDITATQNLEIFVNRYVLSENIKDAGIYVFFSQRTNLVIHPANLNIEAEVVQVNDSIKPYDRAWVYDTGVGDWGAYRFTDTGLAIKSTLVSSYYGQGTLVATGRNILDYLDIPYTPSNPKPSTDLAEARLGLVMLDNVENVYPNLQGVYKPKFRSTRKIFFDAASLVTTKGNLLKETQMMDLWRDSGVVINQFTISVSKPFAATQGRNPTLTIGTASDSSRWVQAVEHTVPSVQPSPTRPVFDYGKPITVDVFDEEISLNEGTEALVRLVRSGNIFVTPSSIRVINPGWGYDYTSTPRVTVLGPVGVEARANVTGRVVGYAVVDGGNGYDSNTVLGILGGGGQGALGTPRVDNGRISSVDIPGAGVLANASVTLTEGKVSAVSISGNNWEMEPIVRLIGGTPARHAALRVVMNDDGSIKEVIIDDAGEGYKSEPTVQLLAHTGDFYTSAPRVVVSSNIGGREAVIEPIMIWSVRSIDITSWGKCSWTGNGGAVIVDPPRNGAAPVAVIVSTPEVQQPTVIHQMRYRVVSPVSHPEYGRWNYVGGANNTLVTFPVPTDSNNPDYWLQSIRLPVSNVEGPTQYELQISDVITDLLGASTGVDNIENGDIGGSGSSYLTIHNTIEGERDIDLTRAYTKVIKVDDVIDTDEQMFAYFNPDGVSEGLVSVLVEYHYNKGFELLELNEQSTAVFSKDPGQGGNLLSWKPIRFANRDGLMSFENQPADGWRHNDFAFMDDGRAYTERARLWNNSGADYDYHELTQYNGKIYRSLKGGRGSFVKANLIGGKLDNTEVKNPGTPYTGTPEVEIQAVLGGSGAVVAAKLAPTKVYRIRVIKSGTGYDSSESLIIKPRDGFEGRDAHARVSKFDPDGGILEVEVTAGGFEYDGTPDVFMEFDEFRTEDDRCQLEAILVASPLVRVDVVEAGSEYPVFGLVIKPIVPSDTFDITEWEVAHEAAPYWSTVDLLPTGTAASAWVEVRRETPQVESNQIDSAVIYNSETHDVLQTLQLYDPYKGIIPGIAAKELSYMLEYDPAVYVYGYNDRHVINANQAWGIDQVGALWWDLSTVRYLNYEIDSDDYKARNWGKLAPGVSVDIYEWTRSTVAPQDWDTLVKTAAVRGGDNLPTGVVKDVVAPGWVQRDEFNDDLNRMETVYYFWVRNVTTVPPIASRNLTAIQVANIIQDPTNSDIAWFAVMGDHQVLVGGIKNYLNDTNTVLRIKWRLGSHDGNDHKQWILMRDGDERNVMDLTLWNKMRDSLVGWDKYHTIRGVEARVITAKAITNTIQVDDASVFRPFGQVTIMDNVITYQWINGNTLCGTSSLGNLAIPSGTLVTQDQNFEEPKQVPGKWLSPVEAYGTQSRPRQSWFRQDTIAGRPRANREARRILVETLNGIFAREAFIDTRFDWRDVFVARDAAPARTEYSYEAEDLLYRDQLAVLGKLERGQRVFVDGLGESKGFWTLWRYDPDQPDSDSGGFVLERAQRWRMQEDELWEAVDWYADGFSSKDFPVRRFADKAARDAAGRLDITLLKGTLVRVDKQSDSDTRWSWSLYTENGWQDVAKGNGTIRLKDDFWLEDRAQYGFGSYHIEDIATRDGSWEIQWIIDQLLSKIFTSLERNELFFSMVHAAQAQHQFVDWAIKTSFLYLAGYKEEVKQSPIVHKDQINNLISYIEDVKPFHVKLRDFVRRLSVPVDVANLHITDFDKPVYFDATINGYRKLYPDNPVDQQILSTNPLYKDWWTNYRKHNTDLSKWNGEWNPVRRPKITLLLDRVACEPVVGWDPIEVPWDSTEVRWKGTDYMASLSELSDVYRKVSSLVADWRKFYSDYKVYVVNAAKSDDNRRVNISGSLWSLKSAKPNQLAALVDPFKPTNVHSVWRCRTTFVKPSDDELSNYAYKGSQETYFYKNLDTYWEPFEYRNLSVTNEEERDRLLRDSQKQVNKGEPATLQTGDIVSYTSDPESYMWTGKEWKLFYAVKWDVNAEGGLADRIDEFYSPEPGQKRKELSALIRGCDFRGATVDGGDLEQGLWDMFAWDFEGGWANEFDYYVGRDVDLNNSEDQYEQAQYGFRKYESNWRLDNIVQTYTGTDAAGELQKPQDVLREYLQVAPNVVITNTDSSMDLRMDASGKITGVYRKLVLDQYGQWINDPEDQRKLVYEYEYQANGSYKTDSEGAPQIKMVGDLMAVQVVDAADKYDIVIEGNQLSQPWFDSGHPDELVRLRVRNPMMITVYEQGDKPSAMRLFKDAVDHWELNYLENNSITLARTLKSFDREMIVQSLQTLNDGILHDPENPSDQLFQKVFSNTVYHMATPKKAAAVGNWTIEYTDRELLNMFSSDTVNTLTGDLKTKEVRRVFAQLKSAFVDQSKVWIKALDRSRVVTDDADTDVLTIAGKMRGFVVNCVLADDFSKATITLQVTDVKEAGSSKHWGVVPGYLVRELGAMWVGNERITYSSLDAITPQAAADAGVLVQQGVNYFVLHGVSRAVGGTSLNLALQPGTPVFDAGILHRLDVGDQGTFRNESTQALLDRRATWDAVLAKANVGPSRPGDTVVMESASQDSTSGVRIVRFRNR